MNWLDAHCDVLWKIWENKSLDFYEESNDLDVTYQSLIKSAVKLQVFAIFIPPEVPQGQKWSTALEQIDLFYEKIIKKGVKMVDVNNRQSLEELAEDQCGALLALEGADALTGNLTALRILHRLGVRQIGLTWNHANEVADGILETRGGGLTQFGKQLLEEMKSLSMIVDVSHLSIRGFWDVMESKEIPVIASHSNSQQICPHVRNLSDEQILALINREGLIGVNFVPYFLSETGTAQMSDIIRHIDHICCLGGSDHLCFGSDFDGFEEKVPLLEKADQLYHLKNKLLQHFPKNEVRKWGYENGLQFYKKHLLQSALQNNREKC